MVWGPYLKLMARRPAALKYTGFFKELPTTIQDYFAKCDYTEKKRSLNILLSILQTDDMTTAEKAFAESCRRKLINADSLLAIYHHQNSHLPEDNFLKLPHQLPGLRPSVEGR